MHLVWTFLHFYRLDEFLCYSVQSSGCGDSGPESGLDVCWTPPPFCHFVPFSFYERSFLPRVLPVAPVPRACNLVHFVYLRASRLRRGRSVVESVVRCGTFVYTLSDLCQNPRVNQRRVACHACIQNCHNIQYVDVFQNHWEEIEKARAAFFFIAREEPLQRRERRGRKKRSLFCSLKIVGRPTVKMASKNKDLAAWPSSWPRRRRDRARDRAVRPLSSKEKD